MTIPNKLSQCYSHFRQDVAQIMLEAGGDPRLGNMMSETPFDVAANEETRRTLKEWDITVTDDLVEAVNQSKVQ